MTGAAALRRCEWCGDPAAAQRGRYKFCSFVCRRRACMDRFRRGENVVRNLTCAECGTAFASVRRDARFCTRRCSNRWHNAHRQPRNRLVEGNSP